MADVQTMNVPPQVRDLVENSVIQARTAFGDYMDAAKRNAEMMKHSTELSNNNLQSFYNRNFLYAEENVQAAFDYAQRLVRANSLQEIIQLQMSFIRSQYAAMQLQAKELGGVALDAMKDGAEQAGVAMQKEAAQTHAVIEQGEDAAKQTFHSAEHAVDHAKH